MSAELEPKCVGTVMRVARECSAYATVGGVEEALRAGVPVFFRDGDTWRHLTGEGAVGYPRQRRVIDVPAEAVIEVAPQTSLSEARGRMEGLGVGALPVVLRTGLVGAVSAGELMGPARTEYLETSGILHDVANLVQTALLEVEESAMQIGTPAAETALRILGLASETIHTRRNVAPVRPLDVAAEIDALVPLLTSVCGGVLRLQCECAPGLPEVRLHPVLLRRVLINIALNTRAACADGNGILRVYVDRSDDGAGVVLRLSDDGPGLPPHVVRRLKSTNWRGWHGSQGLDVVRRLAGEMGATLRITSVPGAGTSFELFLPAA